MSYPEDIKNIFGGENNHAWNQHLYLQQKAREAAEARRKQVAEAEKFARELKEKNMSDKNENVWINDGGSIYSESLNHIFNDVKIRFGLFKKGFNKVDDPLLIAIHDIFDGRTMDDTFIIRFDGDIADAKKMIKDSIEVFDKKQNVNIYKIKDYFSIYMEQQNNLRSADSFVKYFEGDDDGRIEKVKDNLEKQKEERMEIVIQNQKEYDEAVKNNSHKGNELVIQNCKDFISVSTDVTVAGNGRCKSKGDNPITITVRENGAITAEGKTTIIGFDNANIVAKGNCVISLEGAATAHAEGNCNINLKGKSKISVNENCTVHAYDDSMVSAFGKCKVFTYQKATAKGTDITSLEGKDVSTLIGKKQCSIKARDNCIVFATDGCKVEAADNCLVIANKEAKIVSQDNCVVMSKDNPDVTLFDQADHLNLDTITDMNIMGCLKRLSKSKAFVERPYISLQLMMANIPPERKEAVNRRLVMMGCKDQVSTKNFLYNKIMVGSTNLNAVKHQKPHTARKESGYMER